MPDKAVTCDLFDRWERVWHDGQYDLIPGCVGADYIRHDENGDRTVTREAYAEELAGVHKGRPGIRVVVYDHSFTDDRVVPLFLPMARSEDWRKTEPGRNAELSH